ncbi:NEP1-interacting protein 1 [Spinacia oleracea]|uniref:NEP1-interacting protein 1 n=1 Tax=Spinacia oleracea TaxID=3562 RepID=A0ABM3QUF8_SPIOL|nr:NEP1-interacting protein 1-like [Spinacia oleracea]
MMMVQTIVEDVVMFLADVLVSFLNRSKALEMEMRILEESFSETLEEDNNMNYLLGEMLQGTTMNDNLEIKGSCDSCPICLQDMAGEQSVRCLVQCQHQFHKLCIDKWLVLNNSCPICRRHNNMHVYVPII